MAGMHGARHNFLRAHGKISISILITRFFQPPGLGALQQPLSNSSPAFSVSALSLPMAYQSKGVQVIPNAKKNWALQFQFCMAPAVLRLSTLYQSSLRTLR